MKANAPSKIALKFGILIYVVSALAFLSELFAEITGYSLFYRNWLAHELIEILTFIGFLVGAFLIWRSQKLLAKRNAEIELHLRAAQGEFFAMVNLQFDRWGLSKAERDIALLTTKGLSVAEIADLRNTTQGTVKSQNNSIYRKAKVNSRTQLLGALIDELFIEDPIKMNLE
ncbi:MULTISPECIES: helix-turn-helix transcriptional regulator [Falsihalocynthiibacter]|uniref:helix-turn-helix transcriptional regulator n=2 Tax=Roseobacteraceae TaxID=2854170 RepID=UPI0030036133